MKLKRATLDNALFDELEIQWRGQISHYGETLDDYIPGFREHARSVIEGSYKNYFVYVLSAGDEHVGFAHVGHAGIKGLPGITVRAVEIFLSPALDYEDIGEDKMAQICGGFFHGLYHLAQSELPAQNIKMHVAALDKQYLLAYAKLLAPTLGLKAHMQGSWVVLTE